MTKHSPDDCTCGEDTNARVMRCWRLVHKATGQLVMHGDLRANTKSEARARFKECGEFERIPVSMMVITVSDRRMLG